jgi:hypothetical protein
MWSVASVGTCGTRPDLVPNLAAEGEGLGEWLTGAARYAVPGDAAPTDGESDPGVLPAGLCVREAVCDQLLPDLKLNR